MESIQTIIAKINSLPIHFQTPDNLGESELMQEMNELQKQMFCQTMNKVRKSKKVAFSLCFFLGVLGGHRYYIGDYAIGAVWTIIALIIQNISESLIFIPVMAALVDFLWILDRIKEHNRDKSLQVAAQVKNSENPFLTPAIEKALKYAEIENFEEAIRELKNVLAMPGSEVKAGEIKQKLTEYQNKLDRNIFRQAVEHVTKNNFAKAISSLKQIAPTSENYQEAQQKITDYQNAFGDYLFQQAQEMASQSRFDKALESLKLIPEGTQAYQQVREKIAEYEELLKQQALERAIEKALKYTEVENFEEAIRELKNVLAMPGSEVKAGEIKQKLTEYQNKLDRNIFRQAVEHVTKNNFAKAISSLKQIAPTSENYQEAQQKITDYQNAFGDYLFQQAQEMASQSRFDKALESLKLIPEGTQAYQQVREKIAEYEELLKQQALERENLIKQQDLEREKAEKARQEQLAIEREKIEQQQRMVQKEKEELISKFQNLISVTYKKKLVAAVLLDKTLYLVDSVKRTRAIPALGSNTYADGEFLIITLVVRNEDKKSRTISVSEMTLVDSEEREFSTSSEGGTALSLSGVERAEFLLTEIQPGLEKRISIVFDIPPNAKDLKLKVYSGLFGKPTLLPLSLALGEF